MEKSKWKMNVKLLRRTGLHKESQSLCGSGGIVPIWVTEASRQVGWASLDRARAHNPGFMTHQSGDPDWLGVNDWRTEETGAH